MRAYYDVGLLYRYLHVPQRDFAEKQDSSGVSFIRVTVIGAFRYHVGKIDSLSKHVARLANIDKVECIVGDFREYSPQAPQAARFAGPGRECRRNW